MNTTARTLQLVAVALILVAVGTALYLGLGDGGLFGYIGLVILVLLVLRESDYRKWILVLAFGGVAAGWRGFTLWEDIRLYIPEIFVWLGLAISLIDRSHGYQKNQGRYFPVAGFVLAILALIAVIVGVMNSHNIISIIGDAKAFILFVPAFVLVRRWVSTMDDVRVCIYTVVVAGTLIALSGAVEYFFPQLAKAMPFVFPLPSYTRANFGGSGLISLASFSAWGTPVVVVILVPILGLWIAAKDTLHRPWRKLWYLVTAILVTGIIISGYRSSWMGLLMLAGIVAFYDRKSSVVILVGLALLVFLLPSAFLDRFSTIWMMKDSGDSSILRREYTIEYSTNVILENPVFGIGWGTFATFNDWINIAVVSGFPGALALLALYLGLVARLFSRVRMKVLPGIPAPAGFLAGMAGYMLCMNSGAMSSVPPLMMAFWLVFSLSFRYSELLKIEARKPRRRTGANPPLSHEVPPNVVSNS